MLIQTKRDVIVMTGLVTLLCIILAETSVGLLYYFGGATAFTLENAILFAGLVPFLIAIPISAYMAEQSLDLYIAQQELRRLANTDSLTGLPNRRSFFHVVETLLQEAAADQTPCTLLILDADHFKDINDSYGHAVGDRALVAIADVLRHKFRQSDLICRVGGEEFAILLHDMEDSYAHPLADRVVKAIANSPLVEENAIIEYSVSCGVADTSTSYHLPSLFKHADDAMYTAKERGRNRAVLIEVAA